MAPTIQYQKALGGTFDDGINSVISMPNNKLVVAGYAESNDGDVVNSHSSREYWIIQLDSSLNIEWSKCFGGSMDDIAYSVKKCLDGGFILAGSTMSNDGDVTGLHGGFLDDDAWIVKIDSLRNIQWQHCYGGVDPDHAVDIILTSVGGYFLVAQTESNTGVGFTGNHGGEDIWACKLDSTGGVVWSKCLGGSGWDTPASCFQTLDGGFLITGSTQSNDGNVTGLHGSSPDAWVTRLNSNGVLLWQKCYGGTSIENGYKILPASNSGFYLVSAATSHDGDVTSLIGVDNMWLVRCDSIGTILWEKCYGQFADEPYSAIITSDGGIAMAGKSVSDSGQIPINHGVEDFAVIKVDSIGNFEWGNAFGGSMTDIGYSICETNNHNLVIGGHTFSIDGDVTNAHGGSNSPGDGWVVKLSSLPLSISEQEFSLMNLEIFQNYDQLSFRFFSKKNENSKVFIYDMTGKQIFEKNISVNEGINYNQISCGDFAKGMYVVKIKGENNSIIEKVFIN